jgi:hypothetical protein
MPSNGHRAGDAGRDDMNRHPSGQASANPGGIDAGDHAIIAALAGDPLGRLLAAAAAPGSPRDLLGEDAAAATFRSAAAMPAPPAIRDRRPRRVTIALAAQAACALLVVLGGVALAAGTGVLPNPLVDVSTSLPVPPSAAPSSTVPTAGPSSPAPASTEQLPPEQPVPASLPGLCRAYQAHGGDGESMSSEAFAALVAAAGGADRVDEFCASILADESGESGDEHGPPTEPAGERIGSGAAPGHV